MLPTLSGVLLYLLFILITSVLWAKLEIEIEGCNGWAASLPTWRIEKHVLLDLFYGGRPLTGYHVWAFSSVLFFFHLPLFVGHAWSSAAELRAIGGYSLFWVLEDFLWFALNPHFGIRKFSRNEVWWHKRWIAGLPVDYWLMTGLAASLIWLSYRR